MAQDGVLVGCDFIGSVPPHPTAFYVTLIALISKAIFSSYAACPKLTHCEEVIGATLECRFLQFVQR